MIYFLFLYILIYFPFNETSPQTAPSIRSCVQTLRWCLKMSERFFFNSGSMARQKPRHSVNESLPLKSVWCHLVSISSENEPTAASFPASEQVSNHCSPLATTHTPSHGILQVQNGLETQGGARRQDDSVCPSLPWSADQRRGSSALVCNRWLFARTCRSR